MGGGGGCTDHLIHCHIVIEKVNSVMVCGSIYLEQEQEGFNFHLSNEKGKVASVKGREPDGRARTRSQLSCLHPAVCSHLH